MNQSRNKSPADLFAPNEVDRASERVAEALGRIIATGAVKAGELLPPERTLASRFRVTRNTVREALRQLEQLRLVSVRQGRGATVRDVLANAGIEFLIAMLSTGGARDPALLLDLVDARDVVGRAICDHAIDRLDPGAVADVIVAIEAFAEEAARPSPNLARLQQLDFDVQHCLHHAGSNHALVLLHNSLGYVYERISEAFEPLMARPLELAEQYEKTAAALIAGDRVAAKKAMARVFALGSEDMHIAYGKKGSSPHRRRKNA